MATRLGRRFSNSTVIDSEYLRTSNAGTRRYRYTLKCDCGNIYKLSDKAFGQAAEPCAKCRKPQQKNENSLYRNPLFNAWQSMHNRCSNPNDPGFANYGGRGIHVCAEWTGISNYPGAKKGMSGFRAFLEDMGDRPKGHTLERIDNNGPYSKANCKWATPAEQAKNRRTNVLVTLDGETKIFKDWCKQAGLDYRMLLEKMRGTTRTHEYMLNRYWIKVRGVRKRFTAWANEFSVDPNALWGFVDKSGLEVWDAFELVAERRNWQPTPPITHPT